MPIYGWDASDFDWDRGPMDLGAAVRDGIVFFTHKATEGTRVKHVHYAEALHRARAAGMPFMGAYFVPRTPGNGGNGTIAQQVAYFLAYLDSQTPWWRSTPEFFIQVDTEHWSDQTGPYDEVAPQHGALACVLLRSQTGKRVIHYAPRWSYGDTTPGDDPLWASSYGSNPAVPYRQAYPGDAGSGWAAYSGRTPTFLQYGSRLTIGRQPGCDANAFRGTLDQLRALITGGQQTMALGNDPDGVYLIWRGAAIALRHRTFLGGPEEGRPVPFNVDFDEVLVHVRKLDVIGNRLDAQGLAIAKLLEGQGVEQADIDALLARPTNVITVTPEMVTSLAAEIGEILIAHPDTPLSDANQTVITAATEKALDNWTRARFGQRAAIEAPTQG